MERSFIFLLILLTAHLNAQHFAVERTTNGLLADFNGGSNMYLQMKENGFPRGYIGSFSGTADDFDLGTSSSNIAGDLHFTIQAIPSMTLKNSGNFGIGNTNPTEKLHVNGNIRVQDDADIFGVDQIVGFNDIRFYGDATDGPDLFIAANGKVGIGTTSPDATLHLNGDMKLGNLLFFATPVSFRMWGNLEPQDTNPTFHNRDLGHTDHWWDDVYALEFKGPSDIRYKKNVQPLNYGLDAVLKMRPVSFLWKHKKDDGLNYGLIAQELIEIIPELVSSSNADNGTESDSDAEPGYLNVSYMELIPVLIKSIQEQNDLIQVQQKELFDLKSKLSEYERLNQRLTNLEEKIRKM